MARPMTAGMLAAIQAGRVDIALLFEGRFKNGMVNIWTGLGDLDYDGKIWSGVGQLLGLSPVEETDEVKASGITVSLTGVRPSDIALALAEMERGLPGVVWLALFALDGSGEIVTVGAEDAEADDVGDTDDEVGDAVDEVGTGPDAAPAEDVGDDDDIVGAETSEGQMIPDPIVWFRGQMDVCIIADDVNSPTIRVSYENELITLETPREVRYTDEEQKRLYPGDLGLEDIAGLQDKVLPWGTRV